MELFYSLVLVVETITDTFQNANSNLIKISNSSLAMCQPSSDRDGNTTSYSTICHRCHIVNIFIRSNIIIITKCDCKQRILQVAITFVFFRVKLVTLSIPYSLIDHHSSGTYRVSGRHTQTLQFKIYIKLYFPF